MAALANIECVGELSEKPPGFGVGLGAGPGFDGAFPAKGQVVGQGAHTGGEAGFFPENPADAVAFHRVARTAGHHQGQARPGPAVPAGIHQRGVVPAQPAPFAQQLPDCTAAGDGRQGRAPLTRW